MRVFQSLRFRLILLVLLAVIPAIIVTIVTGLEQRRLARENAEQNALRLARAVANYQVAQIESARQLTQALAVLGVKQFVADPDRCHLTLKSMLQQYPTYAAFSLVDIEGNIICSSSENTVSLNVADRDYFRTVMETGEFTIGRVIVTRITKNLSLPFGMPVLDETGKPVMAMIALLNLEAVTNLAETIDLPPDSTTLLVEDTGTIVMRYPSNAEWTGNSFKNVEIVQEILKNNSEGRVESTGLDGIRRFYGFTPVLQTPDFSLMASVGIPTRVAFADVDRALWNNLFFISVIAVLSGIIAWFGGDLLFLRVVSLTAERDEAEEKLRQANHVLESRVAERTAALDAANKQLSYELDERQKMVESLRQREEELENMLTLVERSNRELEHFAYITSHDLQEPLRKIQAFGERLLRRYGNELGEEGATYITRMSSSANRMQKMVDDLLAYSRIQSHGSEFVPVDLNDVFRDVISDLEIRISETHGKITSDPLPIVRGDPSQMRQLFQNLLVNALKFHRQGVAPIVKVQHIINEPESAADGVVLVFADNGIGFEMKYHERIFLPFQRLHGQDVFEGSGIGLAICRKILQRHGGSITAESEPGVGSRFIVRLPNPAITSDKGNLS